MKTGSINRATRTSGYLILAVIFVLLVNVSLGFLLMKKASNGEASADDTKYEDAWGSFYSAYSPVFDSKGEVSGIAILSKTDHWTW